MKKNQKKTPWEKEWELLEKQEKKLLEKRGKKKGSALNRFLDEKIPQTLQERLDVTFSKAFGLIFEKGTGIIEKTYKKEDLEKDYKINAYAASVKDNRKSLKKFSKKAGVSGNVNLLISGAEGIGLGLLGIGLPDIPVFVAMILKSLYEISLHYGIGYDSEGEKYFILLLIRAALSYDQQMEQAEVEVQQYIDSELLSADYDREREIRKTADTLSGELLYMKFLQGMPVVGAVGGAYDAVYLQRILEYAKLKYRKRFLLKHQGHTSVHAVEGE